MTDFCCLFLMNPLFRTIGLCLLVAACSSKTRSADQKVSDLAALSEDKVLLSTLIDLKVHTPTKVKFKKPTDNDSTLQACLTFNDSGMNKVKEKLMLIRFADQHLKASDFDFQWLDQQLRRELEAMDSSYHGHPDFLFASGGKLWIMDHHILLKK